METLATTRKARSALRSLPTAQINPLSKTRQANKKKLEDLIKEKETLLDDLSSQLKVARGEIDASRLEIQKDNLILELNLKIVTFEDAAYSWSREFDLSLGNSLLELRKAQRRSQRLTNEWHLTKLKHDSKI